MSSLEIIRNFHNNLFGYKYNELREEFIKIFITQCGNLQFEEVKRRVENSNTFRKLIAESKTDRTHFNEKTIIGGLLTIPYFMFKGGYVQYLASLLVLEKWNKEVNSFAHLISESELDFIAIGMYYYFDRTKGFRV